MGDKMRMKKVISAVMAAAVAVVMLACGSTDVFAAGGDPSANGADLDSLEPAETMGLVITGDPLSGQKGFRGNIFYLTKAQIAGIKDSRSTSGYGTGSFWLGDTVYSSHDPHGTGHYHYTRVEGLDLQAMLTALGTDTAGVRSLYYSTSDNYPGTISDHVFSGRYYYPPGSSEQGGIRYPVIAMYKSETSSGTSAGTELPAAPEKLAAGDEVFIFGQKTSDESNNCLFAKHVDAVILNIASFTDRVTSGNITGILRVNDLMELGIYRTSYSYSDGTSVVTDHPEGVPLTAVIGKMGLTSVMNSADSARAAFISADGSKIRTVKKEDVSKCFAAWGYSDGKTAAAAQNTQFMLYMPGNVRDDTVLENFRTVSFIDADGKIAGTSNNIRMIAKPYLVSAGKKLSGRAAVRWKKVSGAAGYQVSCGSRKIFAAGLSKTVSGLTKGKTYKVKVRAYRMIDGQKVYGKYSAARKVRV
jgi:hypothetical protein